MLKPTIRPRLMLLFICLAGSACLRGETVACGDSLCPNTMTCAQSLELCVLPEQLSACDGAAPDARCNYSGVPDGICRDGVCLALVGGCGNGVLEAGEICDDGNIDSGDGCSSDCLSLEVCGNGIRDIGEGCDCGTEPDSLPTGCETVNDNGEGASCREDCSLPGCGDGFRTDGELCEGNDLGGADCRDLGFYDAAGLACSSFCAFDTSACTGYCGDRVLTNANGEEICDGQVPLDVSCLDLGFQEPGFVGCLASCAYSTKECRGVREAMASPTTSNLNGVWAAAPDDIFAVGNGGTVLHYDGADWQTMTSGTSVQLRAVWGSGPDDVFAVGSGGRIIHYDGSSWTTMTSGTSVLLEGVWGSGANDVFAVGWSGTILHYDGSSWTTMTSGLGTNIELFGVWGTTGTDVYAVGAEGTIIHYNGSWSAPMATGTTTASFYGVWGRSSDEVYAVGGGDTNGDYKVLRLDGGTWQTEGAPLFDNYLLEVWGSGDRSVYAVGSGGTLVVREYGAWVPIDLGSGTNNGLNAIHGSGLADVIAVGASGTILRWNRTRPAAMESFADYTENRWAISGASADHVIAAGPGALLFDGATWTPEGPRTDFNDVWVYDAKNAFAVGANSVAYHRDGGGVWNLLERIPAGHSLQAVWGAWEDKQIKVFAVGTNGTTGSILQGLNFIFTEMEAPTIMGQPAAALYLDISGTGASDVYAVGVAPGYTSGVIVHFDGISWTVAHETPTPVVAVWASGPDEVFAVGSAGTILHYNGTTWSEMASGTTADLTAVWGTGPTDVYAAGQYGVVRHYDGIRWLELPLESADAVYDIWGLNAESVFFSTLYSMNHRAQACAAAENRCSDGRDDDCDHLFDCADPDCTGSPECPATTPLACGDILTGLSQGGSQRFDAYACSDWLTVGREVLYEYTAAQDETVTASLSDFDQDLDLIVVRKVPGGGCNPRSPDCIGASSTVSNETVSFDAKAGESYCVIVDGFASSVSSFDLALECL